MNSAVHKINLFLPGQNGGEFTTDNFKCDFINENRSIAIFFFLVQNKWQATS